MRYVLFLLAFIPTFSLLSAQELTFSDPPLAVSSNTAKVGAIDLDTIGPVGSSFVVPTDLWIYPVPAKTIFTIEAVDGVDFVVYAPGGRLITKGLLTGARTRVPCEGWKSGVYSVVVRSANGTVLSAGRVLR